MKSGSGSPRPSAFHRTNDGFSSKRSVIDRGVPPSAGITASRVLFAKYAVAAPASHSSLRGRTDECDRFSLAYRRSAKHVEDFAGEWRPDLFDHAAVKVRHPADESVLCDGVPALDRRTENARPTAPQHLAALDPDGLSDG